MTDTIDVIRVLSLLLSIATMYIVIGMWRRHPRFLPQFALILAYMFHGFLYYSVLLVDRITPTEFLTSTFYTDWGAIVRFHSFATWFFVALLYARLRRKNNG